MRVAMGKFTRQTEGLDANSVDALLKVREGVKVGVGR